VVGDIYIIDMPFSDFKNYKKRPVMVYKILDKNDLLILPLTTNLKREGIIIKNQDLQKGKLMKDSVLIVPKITAIDKSLIKESRLLATLNEIKFKEIQNTICEKLNC